MGEIDRKSYRMISEQKKLLEIKKKKKREENKRTQENREKINRNGKRELGIIYSYDNGYELCCADYYILCVHKECNALCNIFSSA